MNSLELSNKERMIVINVPNSFLYRIKRKIVIHRIARRNNISQKTVVSIVYCEHMEDVKRLVYKSSK